MQYSITFRSRLEAVIGAVSSAAVVSVGVDVRVKFSDSRSNLSCDIPLGHFAMDDERTTTSTDGS